MNVTQVVTGVCWRVNASDADAASTPTVARTVAVSSGPDAGERGVVRGHALRSVKHWQRSHHHLRILETVAQPLQDGGELWSLLWYGMPALTHQTIQWTWAVVGRL